MSDSTAELASKASALPPEERARLAEQLLESLQTNPSAEVEAEWDAEIQSRIAALDSGASQPVPAAEVFAQVRRSLG